MSARITITTKGVKGAGLMLQEFIQNVPRVLGSRPLEEYASNTVDNMSMEAPVDTGYLRSFIRWSRVNPTEISIMSWAPYSGFVDQGTHLMPSRPFFSDNTINSGGVGANEMAFASQQYLRILINKYQNMP